MFYILYRKNKVTSYKFKDQKFYKVADNQKMIEKQIEKYLTKKIKELKGLCLKFESPGYTGVPDRIIILKNKPVAFVELKRPVGGRYSARQKLVERDFNRLGQKVYKVKNKEEVDKLVEELIK